MDRPVNNLSPPALCQALADMVALDRAGLLEDAEAECELVCQEEARAYVHRTVGASMAVRDYAGRASKLLALNKSRCEQAAQAVLFPGQAQVVARVLRLWAKDIKRKGR